MVLVRHSARPVPVDCPPLRPADDASSRSWEKERFSAGTERPPLLAISRCRSIFIDAKPRFEVELPDAIRASSGLVCTHSSTFSALDCSLAVSTERAGKLLFAPCVSCAQAEILREVVNRPRRGGHIREEPDMTNRHMVKAAALAKFGKAKLGSNRRLCAALIRD